MGARFDSPDELAAWLEEHGIETAVWGSGQYKSISNLWDEYMQGEVSFVVHPAMRVVRVVQVRILQNKAILLEAEQVFRNGERRFRNQPPSEKIKGDESHLDAAYRCLSEELGVSRDQVDLLADDNIGEEWISDSPSYPGLQTRYRIQSITVRVRGLPEKEFWRENKAASDGDPVDEQLWVWREA